MGKENLKVGCNKCETEWAETFDLPMNTDKFVDRITNLKCPSCGSGKDYIYLHQSIGKGKKG